MTQVIVNLDEADFSLILDSADRVVDFCDEYLAWNRSIAGPVRQLGSRLFMRVYREGSDLWGKLADIGLGGERFWIAAGSDAADTIASYARFPDPDVRIIIKSARHYSFVEDVASLTDLCKDLVNRFTMNQFIEENVVLADFPDAFAVFIRRIRRELDQPLPGNDDTTNEEKSEPKGENISRLFVGQVPDDVDIVDLVVRIDAAKGTGKSRIEIARELTKESPDNDPKASKLLARIRMMKARGKLKL